MADVWIDPATINGGQEYNSSDGMTIDDINTIIEDLKYLKKHGGSTPAIESYGGAITIVGALISFTLNDVIHQARSGMTWAQWCESAYNTGGWSVSENNIMRNDGTEIIDNVTPTDVIIAEAAYTYTVEVF